MKGSYYGITEKPVTVSPLYFTLCRSYHVNLRLGIMAFSAPETRFNNLLTSKGISKIKKELKRNGKMTKKELADCIQGLTAQQPFSKQRIGVTNPTQFLDSLLPYMERQEMITKTKENGKVYYYLIH